MTLVCGGTLGPHLHTRGRRSAAKRLVKLGMTVIDSLDAKATAVSRDAVRLANGLELLTMGSACSSRVRPAPGSAGTVGPGSPGTAHGGTGR
ncbi:hypothetical protein ACFYVW_02765 [Streptomyces tendae]|uniref:hypothetical protein n=1 Tax=Streptomyces tendae TaxID=1932 RepID=UPI00369D96C7